MPYRVDWKLHFQKARVHGKRFEPKRPVNWRGSVSMTYIEGEQRVTDAREWVSPFPLTKDQALDVMRGLLVDIIHESGQGAVDAAFWMEVK